MMDLESFKKLSLPEMLAQMPSQEIGHGGPFHKILMPRLFCVDGTSLSVQASRNHSCSPRNDNGPYHKVEVGFPSVAPPDIWLDYAEEMTKPTGTVYAWIPIEFVLFFIAAHGGIDVDRTFDGFEFVLR